MILLTMGEKQDASYYSIVNINLCFQNLHIDINIKITKQEKEDKFQEKIY